MVASVDKYALISYLRRRRRLSIDPAIYHLWKDFDARHKLLNEMTEFLRKEVLIDSIKLRNIVERIEGGAYVQGHVERWPQSTYLHEVRRKIQNIFWPLEDPPQPYPKNPLFPEFKPTSVPKEFWSCIMSGFYTRRKEIAESLWKEGFPREKRIGQWYMPPKDKP